MLALEVTWTNAKLGRTMLQSFFSKYTSIIGAKKTEIFHPSIRKKQDLMADRETLLTESGCNGETESADWLVNLQGYDKKSQEFEYKEWKHLIPFRTIPKYEAQWKNMHMSFCTSPDKRAPSVFGLIMKVIQTRLILATICCILFNSVAVLRSVSKYNLSIYFLQKMIILIESPEDNLGMQIVYLLLIAGCSIARTILYSLCALIVSFAAARARAGVLSLVFKKILKQHNHNATGGQLVNLCANDGQRIFDCILFSVYVFGSVPVVGVAVYSVYLLGIWGIWELLFTLALLLSRYQHVSTGINFYL
ncbi:hypothetical protein EB796_000239 [Bugula neritina]|uniref:ABC transmembrane type-1 domain-containing protein n=1 Tax=Bugula neritina TaxID=10212 RepID=A0A7J7KTF8_BUGNE|nr:hypothetical protein EB796_000239 [Bugula neritina]